MSERPSFNLGERFEVVGLFPKDGVILSGADKCVLCRDSDGTHYVVSITERPAVERA